MDPLSRRLADLSNNLRMPTSAGCVPGTGLIYDHCDDLDIMVAEAEAMENELATLRALLLHTRQDNGSPERLRSVLVIPLPPQGATRFRSVGGVAA